MPIHFSTCFPFRDVVLVADRLEDSELRGPLHLRRNLEKTDAKTLAELLRALRELNLNVHHYADPRTLSINAHRHTEDIVLSVYGGEISRNRMALVPAVCELHNLRYVGPDVYGSIICQDKEVSKTLAHEAGLRTPWHRIIRTLADLERIRTFPTPFVVKPLLEGSSIGITQNNLVRVASDGIAISRELLQQFDQPIMIEEFVRGKEVSYNCIEAHPENHWTYSEIHIEGEDDYFDTHLFDAEEKLNRLLPRRVKEIGHMLSTEDKQRIDQFLRMIGPFGYCRVDGKHDGGSFIFLEITPDAWIAPSGAFAGSFIDKGWLYRDVIAAVLTSAMPDLHDRSANG